MQRVKVIEEKALTGKKVAKQHCGWETKEGLQFSFLRKGRNIIPFGIPQREERN